MRPFLPLALLALGPTCGAQEPDGEGWRELFDGESLAGWSGDPRFWSVRDGEIVGESTAETPCRHTTYLVLDEAPPGDFELVLEARLEVGNSGVQLRSERVGTWDLRGYQADLDGRGALTGTLYEQYGRGTMGPLGSLVRIDGAGARVEEPLVGAPPPEEIQPAEWNQVRVRARGPRVEVALNGVTTSVVVDHELRAARRSGALGVQLHAGPPMRVRFRGLRLRALEATEAPAELSGPPIPPQWIWADPAPAERDAVWLRHEFSLPGEPGQATLWGRCDDRMEVYLNGERVVEANDLEQLVRRNVREHVRAGENVLLVWAESDEDLAGAWLELRLADAGGKRSRVYTDGRWLASRDDPRDLARPGDGPGSWTPVHAFGPVGKAPWGRAVGRTEGTPATALAAAELELPPGFEAELVYDVPRARQGSWVSLAADGRGRLWAGDETGAIYLVEPPEPGGRARVERLDAPIGGAQGLLWAFDALYAVVNSERYGSGLYRMRATEDGGLAEPELLRAFDGDGEHGPHAIVPGPDGSSLWIVGGNHVVPPEVERARARVVLEDDSLLAQLPDPNGHRPGSTVSGGWIARTDPDGERWELVCVGLRNPYDLAFDGRGEPFTLDADMEWDLGLPWYRPTRLLHLVSGADYGWRHGSAKWPDDLPDTLPPALDAGPGSPTGVLSTRGLRVPAAMSDALLLADWAFGRVRLAHLEPKGASYVARLEPFLQGRPLPVCDLAADPEGALWFVTGGRSLQSGLYRVRYTRESGGVPANGDGAESAEVPTATRRSLEAYHGNSIADAEAQELAWRHLGDPDPYLANAARVALEAQDTGAWARRAIDEQEPRAAAQAWIALARTGEARWRGPLLERLASLAWEELSSEERVALLRACDRVLVHLGPLEPAERERLRDALEARYPTGEARVDGELAALLVELGSDAVVPRTLELLEASTSRRERIQHLFALRLAREGWTLERRRVQLGALDAVLEQGGGGKSYRRFLLTIRDDVLEALSPEELAALGELAGPRPVDEPTGGTTRPFVREWSLARLLPHLEKVEQGRDLERGEELYRETSCLDCHRLGELGGGEGPDLTGAGARFSPRDLVESILWPSATISDQYRDTEIWLVDDGVVVGTVLRETADTLVVVAREPREEIVEIARSEVELRRPTQVSRMPEGLLDVLELEEVLDLLAFVLAERPADQKSE